VAAACGLVFGGDGGEVRERTRRVFSLAASCGLRAASSWFKGSEQVIFILVIGVDLLQHFFEYLAGVFVLCFSKRIAGLAPGRKHGQIVNVAPQLLRKKCFFKNAEEEWKKVRVIVCVPPCPLWFGFWTPNNTPIAKSFFIVNCFANNQL
jgi:hypothetical protein